MNLHIGGIFSHCQCMLLYLTLDERCEVDSYRLRGFINAGISVIFGFVLSATIHQGH